MADDEAPEPPEPPEEVRLDGEGNPIDDEPFRERVVDQWPLALVLGGFFLGLAVLALVDFRVGALMMSVSVVFAGAMRLVLPKDTVGLLAVRSRTIDLAIYGVLGIGLTVLSLVVPPPA